MRQQTLKYSRLRAPVIAFVFVFSLVSLLTTAIGQRQRFYFQPSEQPEAPKPPIIEVKSTKDPATYDTVVVKQGSGSDLRFSVQLRGQCPERHRLERGSISVGQGRDQRKVELPVDATHRSIGPDHGAEWDYFTFVIPFQRPDIGRSPVDVCNSEVNRAGTLAARTKLLQEGFQIDFARAYKAHLWIQCHKEAVLFYEDPDYSAETYLPAVIRCLPTGYKPSRTRVEPQRTAVPDPPITSVSVKADPAETQGQQCPVNVTFRGTITAGESSSYSIFKTKYRFVGENNFKTDWISVSVARGASKSVLWRRFIEAPVNDSTGALKTPGGRVRIPIHRGWMALEVMLPNGTKSSERAGYSVDCNVQGRIKTRR
jgi:hypothetical protein